MTRLSRTFIDFACYHIITRGNQKQSVFIEDSDFIKYLSILIKAKNRYKVLLYSYCLMPNHVHLLIESNPSRKMSNFMHWVNRGYTAYFNTKYGKVGHLWQGRFLSKPILKGPYLVNCSIYIETNPIRAGLINDITEYRWSSYKDRCLASGNTITDPFNVEYSHELAGTGLISDLGTR